MIDQDPEAFRLAVLLRMIAKILHGQTETGQSFATEIRNAATKLEVQRAQIVMLEDRIQRLTIKMNERPKTGLNTDYEMVKRWRTTFKPTSF